MSDKLMKAAEQVIEALEFAPNGLRQLNALNELRQAVDEVRGQTAAENQAAGECERLRAHVERLEAWQREGSALMERGTLGAMFSLGQWWADRPWREQADPPAASEAPADLKCASGAGAVMRLIAKHQLGIEASETHVMVHCNHRPSAAIRPIGQDFLGAAHEAILELLQRLGVQP